MNFVKTLFIFIYLTDNHFSGKNTFLFLVMVLLSKSLNTHIPCFLPFTWIYVSTWTGILLKYTTLEQQGSALREKLEKRVAELERKVEEQESSGDTAAEVRCLT